MNHKTHQKVHIAFTLIELLVVIAIIAILASMLLPTLNQARKKGQQSLCSSNIKQLAQADLMYANDFDDYFTPHMFEGTSDSLDSTSREGAILCYFYNLPDSASESVLVCPSEAEFSRAASAWGNYAWNIVPKINSDLTTAYLKKRNVLESPSEYVNLSDRISGNEIYAVANISFRHGSGDSTEPEYITVVYSLKPVTKGLANVGYGDGHVEAKSVEDLWGYENNSAALANGRKISYHPGEVFTYKGLRAQAYRQ